MDLINRQDALKVLEQYQISVKSGDADYMAAVDAMIALTPVNCGTQITLSMPMPNNCMECRFHDINGCFDRCILTGCLLENNEDKVRHKDCPLKEIKDDRDFQSRRTEGTD